ncbi:MAG: proteasome assembly chaperone family protein [Candidatus Hadarchaeales archaeon]
MNSTLVRMLSEPVVTNPILIEGLPGMGFVGKLAADHLIEIFKPQKFAEILSPHFPHHVLVDEQGILRPMLNSMYHTRVGEKDLIIWTGDTQSVTTEGHYEVVERVLDVAEKLGVKTILTLGGYATGKYVEGTPKVMGVGDLRVIEDLRKKGIQVEVAGGPIVGAAGLVLGLGSFRGMSGLCLLSETHGILIDHRAAQAVLEVLGAILGLKLDLTNLEEKARKTEEAIARLRREMEAREMRSRMREEEESWYIG